MLPQKVEFELHMQYLGASKENARSWWRLLENEANRTCVPVGLLMHYALRFAAVIPNTDIAVDLAIALNRMSSSAGLSEGLRYRVNNLMVEVFARGRVDECFRYKLMAMMVAMPRHWEQIASLLLHDGANASDLYFALKEGTKTLDELADAIIKLSR